MAHRYLYAQLPVSRKMYEPLFHEMQTLLDLHLGVVGRVIVGGVDVNKKCSLSPSVIHLPAQGTEGGPLTRSKAKHS